MAEITYLITVDDTHLDATAQIAQTIRDKGLTVNRVVAGAGAIQATGSESDAAALQSLPGVMEVREEGVVRLPPANRKIPQ